jgi:sporulation protein YlmC with PRC-barrel domain
LTKSTIAAVAAALAFSASAVYAGPIPLRDAGPPVRLLEVALTTQSGELRASQMIGSTVYDVQNRNIGSIKDIVLDREGKVTAVVVDVGAFLGVGGKYVAVPLSDLKTDNDRLTINRSKEQLQAAQSYQLDNQSNSTHPMNNTHPSTSTGPSSTTSPSGTTRQ